MLSIESNMQPQLCRWCLDKETRRTVVRDHSEISCRICRSSFVMYKLDGRCASTIVCYTCAFERNVCQVCLRDMAVGVPIHIKVDALEIIDQEGGSDLDYDRILQAISFEFPLPPASVLTEKPYDNLLSVVLKNLPDFGMPYSGASTPTLFVYGIECDFDADLLKQSFDAIAEKIICYSECRLAQLYFDRAFDLKSFKTLIDGRTLFMAWGNPVDIPHRLHKKIGSLVRHYVLETLRSEQNAG